MRADPRTRICPAAHTHAHIHIYTHIRTRTHVYAHAKEFFWQQICFTALSNRIPSSVRHHSLLLSNRCTIHIHIHIHIGTTLAAPSVQTVIICYHLLHISNHLPTIRQPSTIHHSSLIYFPLSSHISPSSHTHHILSLSNIQSNSPSYQYISLL